MKPKSNLYFPRANYVIIDNRPSKPIIIQDIGPWTEYMTVTNAVEFVIEELAEAGILDGRRLLYVDSEMKLDEICYMNNEFIGFNHIELEEASILLEDINED